MSSRGLLGPLIALFVVLGAVYALATPPFEASDEIWHYPYVQYLQRGLGLPVQVPRPEDNLARQEGSQPPLYYLLAAAFTFFIDDGQPGSAVTPNPHAMVGVPLTPGNKNLAIHSPGDRTAGAGLAVLVIRGLSLLMAAGSVYLVYRLVHEAFPASPPVALTAAALTAFNPEFIFISASVNNDNLIVLLSLVSLLLMYRVSLPTARRRDVFLLGIVLGLALLTKLQAAGLLPLAGLALLWTAWQRRSWRSLVINSLLTGVPALLIAGWWYVRNWVLYGEPTGTSMMLRIVNTRNPPPPVWELVTREFEGFKISFWALFGGVNILADRPSYWFYDLVTVLGLLGLVIVLFRWARARSTKPGPGPLGWRMTLLLLAWAAICCIGLLRWSQTTLASQGRLLFPAMPGLVLPLAAGLVGGLPRRLARPTALIATAALIVMAATMPFRFILPAYAAPSPLTPAELAAISPKLNIDFGGTIRLVAAEVSPGPATFNTRVPVTITWQLLQPVDTNYSIFVHLFGRDSRTVGQFDTFPTLGSRPLTQWQPGDAYRDVYPILIDQLTEGPVMLRVQAGVYDFATGERLTARVDGHDIGTSPEIGRIRLGDPPDETPPQIETNANFDNKIAILGATITQARRFPPGDTRPPAYAVSLVMKALAPMQTSYTVFAQILDDRNRVLSQFDSPPVEGNYPTSLWIPGERIVDRREVPVPAGGGTGMRLVVGFYDPATGARLHRLDGSADWVEFRTPSLE